MEHRDSYVGHFAEELKEAGYYGELIELFCFLEWRDNKVTENVFDDEMDCVLELIVRQNAGKTVSDYITIRRYVNDNKADATILLTDEIVQLAKEKFTCEFAATNETAYNTEASADELYYYFIKSHPFMNFEIKKNLLDSGLAHNKISKNVYAACSKKQKICGFAWAENGGEIKYFINTYIPDVWRKKAALKKSGMLCSEILVKDYNMLNIEFSKDIKEKFQKELASNFDSAYFDFLKSVFEEQVN